MPVESPSNAQAKAIAGLLSTWYRATARDLPWRSRPSPYHTLLSEIMLQQTRVDTVIPYFERFTARYPSVRVLADAPLEEVLGEWSGLGYYRRARGLWAAAREITERYNGVVPNDVEQLKKLPGIGPYTAGAIASIAYEQPAPIVDGNVARVLSRLFAIQTSIDLPAAQKELWRLAEHLVRSSERPSEFNQALMELGALVCGVQKPDCGKCPLAKRCQAKRAGSTSSLPVRSKKKAPLEVQLTSIRVQREGSVLLAQRIEGGLFAGLWEPPMLQATGAEAESAFRQHGVRLIHPIGHVTHILSHRVFDIAVFSAKLSAKAERRLPQLPGYAQLMFVPHGQRRDLSTLSRKLLAVAEPSP